MTSQDFNISTTKLNRRLSTILQHKLRVVCKCYTVVGFTMNPDNSFVFKKSHIINGVRLNDPKEHVGSFEILPKDTEKSTLRISVHE